MNLKEAIELIQETAINATNVCFADVPGDPRRSLLVQGAHREFVPKLPAVRNHKLAELSELCRYVNEFSGSGETVDPVVWHSRDAIVVVLDDADRRDVVTLPLFFTAAWQWCAAVAAAPKRYDSRAFLTLLKTTLADVVDPEQLHNLQTALRDVKFIKRDEASTDVAMKGREALGRSIEQQCTGGDKVPDLLTVTTEIYRNAVIPVESVQVAFDVSIDFENQQFVITAIGDRIANAVDGLQQLIGAHIRTETSLDAVYYGTP